MASSLGSLAIEYAGIQTNIEDPNQSCNWSNLENLIIICGILSPLLCVPVDARSDSKRIKHGDV